MKIRKIIVYLVSLFLLSPLLFSGGVGSETKGVSEGKIEASAKPAEIQELLRTIGKKVSGFRTLKTDFVEEKNLAMFRKKIVLRGRIYMQKPNRLAWHVDKPVKYSVVITDKAIRQWDEDTNQVQEMSLSKNPIFKNVVSQLSVWFSGEYGTLTVENNVSVLRQHPLVLEFIPNEKNIARKMIKSITITFRDDEKYLKKIKISEMSGDTTTIEFFNTLLDVPLGSSSFEVKGV
jgi:outer membrane lipoprotein-sorting protein